jgi:hypothetical protein
MNRRTTNAIGTTTTTSSTGTRVLNALVAAGAILMVLGYLAMNNAAATKGYVIRSAEQRIAELEEQKRKLDFEAVTDQSLRRIEGMVDGLGFVPVSNVEYVNANNGSVAVR